MSNNNDFATVELWFLDQSYKLGCEPEKQQALIQAGELLEQKFQALRENNPRIINQKIAVMVALELMQDKLELQRKIAQYEQCHDLLDEIVLDVEQEISKNA